MPICIEICGYPGPLPDQSLLFVKLDTPLHEIGHLIPLPWQRPLVYSFCRFQKPVLKYLDHVCKRPNAIYKELEPQFQELCLLPSPYH